MAKKSDLPPVGIDRNIMLRSMDDVMHASMMPYAEHVILERALPRVEDGLKPVQRRILYTMMGLSVTPDKPHRKSARIVGDCLGKYHPHGDSSVYDAMVRMAQDFNMQAPLVDGHGNFGSIDGDSPAAMRYTEARMTPLALELLRDIEKDCVDFTLNFDDTQKEPVLLPGRFPNLLVNGTSGIAVGLATNIPPHNFAETIDAVVAQINDPGISLDALMRIMPCPDFPTGGYILDSEEIRLAYETGRGKLTVRAKAEIEQAKNGKQLIVVTEMPYQVNKARALEGILKLTQEKKALFAGVSDIRDESDRMGMRAVVEVRKDADAEKILQYLYKYSDLQVTFGVNMVAIAEGKPQQLGLKELIAHYIVHQETVVTRRTQFDLDAALRREHILEGLRIAILNIDEVIALIRASKTPKEAREKLMVRFNLTEIQAQAILDLRLQRLTNLELLAIENEYKDVRREIKNLRAILASPGKLHEVIKTELIEIKEKYAVARRTALVRDDGAEIETQIQEELRVVEDVTIALLEGDKLRRMPTKPGQSVLLEGERALFQADLNTEKRLRLFTNQGSCFTLPVSDIPETKAGGKPVNLNTILTLENGEHVVSCMEEADEGQLLFFTRLGNIKRTQANEYATRNRRVQAISLKDGDELIGVQNMFGEGRTTILITKLGMSIRFETDTVPEMGRVATGVKCIKLDAGDEVIFFGQIPDEGEILTISDRGYAKRSFVFEYEIQGRNGKGLKTFDFKKNGSNGTRIAAALHVTVPFTFAVEQFHGQRTEFDTELVRIDLRAGKGTLLVMALLDDVVTGAYPKADS
ncbi:MAG TPA: DNA topoisomerase (ATP-hydrolyzing) [Clostridia bacterium]|nr:DNA topoisomerase (ATP-hydrolyzing) [Clostridia bacterium]